MENRFDLYDLPEGHAERFEAKLTPALARHRRRRILFRCTAVAAAVGTVVWLGFGSNRYFRGAHSPEAVYTAYLEQVGDFYRMLANNSEDDSADWEELLHELTDENISLYDQLPDELSDREKTAILKRYYGSLLDEAGQVQKTMKKQKE